MIAGESCSPVAAREDWQSNPIALGLTEGRSMDSSNSFQPFRYSIDGNGIIGFVIRLSQLVLKLRRMESLSLDSQL